jgi:hypothetical protein
MNATWVCVKKKHKHHKMLVWDGGEWLYFLRKKTEACAGQGSVFLPKKIKLCELETKQMNACNMG